MVPIITMKIKDKVLSIRNMYKLSQRGLAAKMGDKYFSETHINDIESGVEDGDGLEYFVMKFKEFLKKREGFDIPITEEDGRDYLKELDRWRSLIFAGDINAAKELQPKLARAAELSHEPYLKNMYDLVYATFLRATRDMKPYDKLMLLLEERAKDFDDLQNYWYRRQLGARERADYRSKSALLHFLEAEKLYGRLNLTNHYGLYSGIGYSFREVGNIRKAVEYLRRARADASNVFRSEYFLDINMDLALCYGQLGRTDEALEILNGHLREEEAKTGNKLLLSVIHTRIGMVHSYTGDTDEALKSFDTAFKYLEGPKKSIEHYIYNLCQKVSLLISKKMYDEANELISEGLSMTGYNKLWRVWLMAMKHSMTPEKQASRNYLKKTAVPMFLEYGEYSHVIKFSDSHDGYKHVIDFISRPQWW